MNNNFVNQGPIAKVDEQVNVLLANEHNGQRWFWRKGNSAITKILEMKTDVL